MDPYVTLKLKRDATQAEIAKAYKLAALACHPDRHPDDPRAAETFDKVSKAYQLLSDPEKRNLYDQGVHVTVEGGVDFATLFAGLFAGAGAGAGATSRAGDGAVRGATFTTTSKLTITNPDGSKKVTTTHQDGSQTVTFSDTNDSKTYNLKPREYREGMQAKLKSMQEAAGIRLAKETKPNVEIKQVPNQLVFRPYGLKDFFAGKGVLCKRVGEHSFQYLTDGEIEELLKGGPLDLSSFWYQTDNKRFTNPLEIRLV